jgi:hypothetical protein
MRLSFNVCVIVYVRCQSERERVFQTLYDMFTFSFHLRPNGVERKKKEMKSGGN